MHPCDFGLVAESRSPNGNDRLDHGGMLSRRGGCRKVLTAATDDFFAKRACP